MSNTTRFLIGLGLFIILSIVGVGAVLLLSPLIIGTTLIIYSMAIIIGILYVIGSFLALIWYFTRKEPDIQKNKNYSIKQSKDA